MSDDEYTDSGEDDDGQTQKSGYSAFTDNKSEKPAKKPDKAKGGKKKKKNPAKDGKWKPPKHCSFETIGLTNSPENPVFRPHGFRKDGTIRKIKETCLMSRMRNLAIIKESNPKMAVCITMYNEDISEL